ncbi:MAG TPA: segregation/condensation protein A [Limnochordia bacterium]|nr:segregation/condensation protein A [Limnochordia bacterium]
MSYLVKLEVFEGPFDLLLNLIEKAEIDIMDIPIARITEDYLDYLRQMQELDLVVSGDFLVMAATLLQIKAQMLLPKKPPADPDLEGEDEADPRAELVRQLLEYKFYKEVAQVLKERVDEVAVFPRAYYEALDKALIYTNCVGDADAEVLAGLFAQVLAALDESKKVTYIKRDMSLAEAIANLRLILRQQQTVTFRELLVRKDRLFIIYTFLAVLELIKLREIYAIQERLFGEIRLVRR